jgi:hypothetical protein
VSDLPDPWTQDRHWILSSVGAVTARSPAIQPSSLLGCVFQLPASNHPRSISTGFLSCVERNIAGHAAERSLPREVWARRTVDQCRKRAAILPTSAGPRAGPRAGPASRGGQPALTARPRHPDRDIPTGTSRPGTSRPVWNNPTRTAAAAPRTGGGGRLRVWLVHLTKRQPVTSPAGRDSAGRVVPGV